ncbi:MAG: spoIIIJ-associated protein [Myxococcota bacterium]|jgi:spoIIIJ-associated protein
MSDNTNNEAEDTSNETELGQKAADVLEDLLEMSGFSAEVKLTETRERIKLDVYPDDEDDAQLMIGRQGHTLAAYQFIVNRVVNRSPTDRKPISLDVSGFAEQRATRLERMAGRIAASVRDNQVQVRILGMNPADRRTVHLALDDEKGISTFSEEEGIARRLVLTTEG